MTPSLHPLPFKHPIHSHLLVYFLAAAICARLAPLSLFCVCFKALVAFVNIFLARAIRWIAVVMRLCSAFTRLCFISCIKRQRIFALYTFKV